MPSLRFGRILIDVGIADIFGGAGYEVLGVEFRARCKD